MSKTAILLGATGLTGGYLLESLLKDTEFEKVKIFGRSSILSDKNAKQFLHPKIEEYIIDMLALEKYSDSFKGDVVFVCIGTTKAKTPEKDLYKAIDYGIPVAAAKLAERNNIDTFIVISAMHADSSSRIFYNRVKGEMEEEVLQKNIPHTFILRPSLIGGDRSEKRIGEQIAQFFWRTFDFLIPQKYKLVKPEAIAQMMLYLAKNGAKRTIIHSDEIKTLSRRG